VIKLITSFLVLIPSIGLRPVSFPPLRTKDHVDLVGPSPPLDPSKPTRDLRREVLIPSLNNS